MLLRTGQALGPRTKLISSRCTLLFALLLLSCVSAGAQGGVDHSGTGGRHSIQGRILFPSGQRVDTRIKVKLESAGFGDLSILSDVNGTFSFRSLRPGSYALIIDGGDNYESVREPIFIETEGGSPRRGIAAPPVGRPYTLQIYLQPKNQSAAKPKAGVLSAALAGIPRPALELYDKALESARKGESHKAIEQLKGALALHPEFALALSQLGVQYMKLKEIDKAAENLRSALRLMPEDYATLLTYGIVLFERRQLPEAEEQLRKALKKNPSSPSAHYYLGLTLLKLNSYEEAEKELLSAVSSGGENIAMAHYYLGGLYWGRHEYKKAADALEMYLRLAPQVENAARLRATIKVLRAKG